MTKAEKSRRQKEIVDSIKLGESGRILLAPRYGKTKIGIDLIKREKPTGKILWATPSARLAEKDIKDEFEKWGAKKYAKQLETTTYASLHKYEGHYGVIVLDEEQAVTENNATNLLSRDLTADVIWTLTGTATKHLNKKEIYKQLGLKVLVKVDINEAVDEGILANYELNIVQVPLSHARDIEAGSKKNRFMTSEFKQYEYLSRMVRLSMFDPKQDPSFRILQRMRFIKNCKSKTTAAKRLLQHPFTQGRRLIFCGSIAQAEEICEHTYHSKSKNNNDLMAFQDGKINEIAMVNAGGIGFTYKSLDHLILLQADSDKNGNTTQKICRTLLDQKDYTAKIWILCLTGTKDEDWVEKASMRFDKTKINYRNINRI